MTTLKQQVLRITTAGSVDDGKSTLIGRLLYESQAVLDDQWEALQKQRLINGQADLSLLTDGLKSEREQGITIDVAYKYFSSTKRKFILADAPGHVQYTRNMVTAASRADVAIILLDARHGVVEQTRRHSYLVEQLGIPHVILAINKIDLINYDAQRIASIEREFRALPWLQDAKSLHTVPLSALVGVNISRKSPETPWYQGPHLLELLESLEAPAIQELPPKLPVQLILRDREGKRLASGTLRQGTLRTGDPVSLWPSQQSSRIREIWVHGRPTSQAQAGEAVAIALEDERDLERGSLVLAAGAKPRLAQNFQAELVWFDDEELRADERYILRLGTQTSRVQVQQLHYRFDLERLEPQAATTLHRNDIARVALQSSRILALDSFTDSRHEGAFILIDPRTFRTVAAGLVRELDDATALNRTGGRLSLVDHLADAAQHTAERVLQLSPEFQKFNSPETQLKVLETLLDSGWTIQLQHTPEAAWLQKRLASRGLGTYEHGLGI